MILQVASPRDWEDDGATEESGHIEQELIKVSGLGIEMQKAAAIQGRVEASGVGDIIPRREEGKSNKDINC